MTKLHAQFNHPKTNYRRIYVVNVIALAEDCQVVENAKQFINLSLSNINHIVILVTLSSTVMQSSL